MPLFHVQEDDRPGYVVAKNFIEAISKWQKAIYAEDPESWDDPADIAPLAVVLIAEDNELIIGDKWVGELWKLT
jgi:hypothetical protein